MQAVRLIASLWVPQTLHAAAVLGVADAIAPDGSRADEIAAATDTHPGALRRLLRAMVALELCTERDDGRFALTPVGATLRSDAPDSVRSWALLMGSAMVWPGWGRLADCVRTGQPAPQLIAGMGPFEWIAAHPEQAAIFDRAMEELTRRFAPVLAAHYDFSRARMVIDVGGGHGALLAGVLAHHPALHGVVFDLAHCADGAAALFAAVGLGDRARFQAGDMFHDVPPGGDVYLLKSVIHDWDDERSIAILRRCRDALAGDARLLIVEVPLPERCGSSPMDQGHAGTDLNMLVMTGGQERTVEEYRRLCRAAGLDLTRVIATPAPYALLEAAPA